MRDYVMENSRTGEIKPVAEVPTIAIQYALANPASAFEGAGHLINPGVSAENLFERLRIELVARELESRL